MNCYNHTDRPAVGQCTNCGKFLCKECLSKYKPALCDECYSELYTAQQKEEKNINRQLIICGIIYLAIYIPLAIMMVAGGHGFHFINLIWQSPGIVALVPFGWRGVDFILNKMNFTLFINPFIYYGLKFVFAMFLGPFFYVFALIRKLTKQTE